MKKLLYLIIGSVTLLLGATKLNFSDIKPIPNSPSTPYLIAFRPNFGWIPVTLDSTITLDTSGAVAFLHVNVQDSSNPSVEIDDEFVTTGLGVFSTSQSLRAGGLIRVHKNGIAMKKDEDYSISGNTVTMLTFASGDFIKLSYQH